jgi:G:T-mismatch repair DNA endonuclease (very short patch repair protein)
MKIRRRCKCGCGGITNYGKKYIKGHNCCKSPFTTKIRRKCKCGCELITNPGKTYIYGHHRKGMGKTKIRRRCKCGCGEITNYGKKYIHGHGRRIKYLIIKIKRRCKCGCGKITKPGNKWILGHNSWLEEVRKKISSALMGNTYAKGKRSEETKRKNSLAAIDMWRDPIFQKKQSEARDIRPNKSEVVLLNLLERLFPDEYKYTGDFSFMINGKNPDFVNVNGQKKIIELFGDYWHKNSNPQDRIDIFTPFGYKTLVIWEHELKKSQLQLRRKLMDFHRR